jgi:type I restriction enzyme M protein
MKSPLKKNMGKKNCELTREIQKEIVRIFMSMEESPVSKIFDNSEFGFWKITVLQPQLDDAGNPVLDKKGEMVPDKEKTDTEIISFTYPGGIDQYLEDEVKPYAPDAWVDTKKTQIGYEMSFTKYFYKHIELRSMQEIVDQLHGIEKETDGILSAIVGESI